MLIYTVMGEDNPDGNLKITKQMAWLIPCDLLVRIEKLWTNLPPQEQRQSFQPSCMLFPNNPTLGNYDDPKCSVISGGHRGSARMKKQSLGFLLFASSQDSPYERFTHCTARTGG
jgi:hypothetical protein